jgi:hypothetical protein
MVRPPWSSVAAACGCLVRGGESTRTLPDGVTMAVWNKGTAEYASAARPLRRRRNPGVGHPMLVRSHVATKTVRAVPPGHHREDAGPRQISPDLDPLETRRCFDEVQSFSERVLQRQGTVGRDRDFTGHHEREVSLVHDLQTSHHRWASQRLATCGDARTPGRSPAKPGPPRHPPVGRSEPQLRTRNPRSDMDGVFSLSTPSGPNGTCGPRSRRAARRRQTDGKSRHDRNANHVGAGAGQVRCAACRG